MVFSMGFDFFRHFFVFDVNFLADQSINKFGRLVCVDYDVFIL